MTKLSNLLPPQNNPDVMALNNSSEGVRRAVEIDIQLQILQTLQAILAQGTGGGSGSGGVLIGNYGGVQPTVTPTSAQALVVDLPAGNLWAYSNGTWTPLIG